MEGGGVIHTIADGNYLMALVSKETTLEKYEPDDLATIPSFMSSAELLLRKEAASRLIEMYLDADKEGVKLHVLSAYRSYDYQRNVFLRNVKIYGSEEEANRYSARPGQSEHQLGTTVDFGGTDKDWTAGFLYTEPGRWLSANSYRYGFIMSYPAGTEHITGYAFEPWHYRYIGSNEAEDCHNSGLVLCQYLKTKPQLYI